jgi:hypothetical protein
VGDLGDLCLGSQNFAAAGERGGGIGAQALTFPFSFSHSSPFYIPQDKNLDFVHWLFSFSLMWITGRESSSRREE